VLSDVVSSDKISLEMTSSLLCVVQSVDVSNEIVTTLKPMVDVSVSLDKTEFEVCNGSSIAVNAIVSPLGTAGTYEWRANGLIVGTNSSSLTLNSFADKDNVIVSFTPSIECSTSLSVSPIKSATISVTNPVVKIDPISNGVWCAGTDNVFAIVDSTLGGTKPVYEWFINGVAQTETKNTIVRNSFVEGDSISIRMTPSAPNAVCSPVTDFELVKEIQAPLVVDVQLIDSTICSKTLFVPRISEANSGKDSTVQYYLNNVLVDASKGLSNLVDGDEVKVVLSSSLTCVVSATVSDSVSVRVIQTPTVKITPENVFLTDFESVALSSLLELNTVYVWSSNDEEIKNQFVGQNTSSINVLPVNVTTQVYLMASITDESVTCSAKDTAVIVVDLNIEVPNAFSPNKDGVNDKFLIDKLKSLDNFKFTVFNKWGSIVFETTDADDLWDGTRNGKDLPVGVYYYIFDYSIAGKSYNKHNYVSLLR
jgi:gliding motility-associated-like protein